MNSDRLFDHLLGEDLARSDKGKWVSIAPLFKIPN